MPLSFELNVGQTDTSVKYLSQGPGYGLLLTGTEAVLSVATACPTTPGLASDAKALKRLEAGTVGRVLLRHYVRRYARCSNMSLRMAFGGANNHSRPEGIEELAAKSNYFVGSDRAKWHVGIPNFARIRYAGIYPGVDLTFYGNRGRLEFDFIVSPRADAHRIVLKFASQKSLRLTRHGDLWFGSPAAGMVLRRPVIYQIDRGRKRAVSGGFAPLSDGRVGLRIGTYNHHEPLIVDPTLSYSTYLDGSSDNSDGDGIAVDSGGNAYVAGTTFSATFPTVNGYQGTAGAPGNGIVFLAKLNPTGTQLLYSTYLGGTGGDYGTGVAIDSSGNAYVTGYTFSTDFPIVNGFQAVNNNAAGGNAFLVRIDTTQTGTASLVYSSYLGGGGNPSNPNPWYGDTGFGVTADSSGHAYITGDTTSDTSVAAFPTTAGAYESTLTSANGNAFLTVMDTTQSGAASLVYSTYLGGDGAGTFGDLGVSVAVDGTADAYLVGQTTSNAAGPFPTTSSAYQSSLKGAAGNAFLTEIATSKSGPLSLVYSTYLGGSASSSLGDMAIGVTLDSAGEVYVTGSATSSDFPTTSGAYQVTNSLNGKAFVAKFDLTQAGAASLVYSTLLGGSGGTMGDWANGIAVDGSGDAFVAGQTSSADFPTTSNAYQSSLKSSGGWNAFLTELAPAGSSLVYSTYLGGSSSFGDVATGVALDALTDAYIVGYTESSDFPTTPGAFQTTLNGSQSAFVAEMDSPNGPSIAITASPAAATIASGQSATYTLSVTSQGSFTSPISFACSGLPEFATCGFSPTSVTPSSGPQETTLTVSTGGGSSGLPPSSVSGRSSMTGTYVLLWLFVGVVASGLCFAGRRQRRFGFLLTVAVVLAGAIGCAQSQPTPLTPAGTSQVTVEASGYTATGIAKYSASVALTVR